jgi:TolB protein
MRHVLALPVLVAALAAGPTEASGSASGNALSATAPARGLSFERDGDIFTSRVDGSRVRNVTRTAGVREFAPAWSPDGARLAYVSYRDGNAEIYLVRPDGSGARRLTRDSGEDLSPAWSPVGRRLAFASNRSGEYEIYVMGADGSGARRLTRLARPGYGSFSPAWSPDGRTIVFSSAARTPENPELYSIRPDGRGLVRLTRTSGDAHRLGDDGFPSWSPEGRTIVFASNRTGDGELWTMRPDGGGQRRLAGLPGRDDWAPRYSPDGRLIAFESRPAQGSDVYVVREDGRGVKLLLRNAAAPSWRPPATAPGRG